MSALVLAATACDSAPGSLSGQRAGAQAADVYCGCLSDPANQKAAPTQAEAFFERCITATEGRFKELMGRVPRRVDQAFEFSNEFHRRARICEDRLRAKLEAAKQAK
jgi:hypothetical protein